jgi:uncharacterized protein (DUF4213/DUF364 family)
MVKEPGFLSNKSALELAQLAYSESLLEAAIGMATINSLIEIEDNFCIEMNAADLIVEKGKGKRIAVVGHFPFIHRIQSIQRNFGLLRKIQRKAISMRLRQAI